MTDCDGYKMSVTYIIKQKLIIKFITITVKCVNWDIPLKGYQLNTRSYSAHNQYFETKANLKFEIKEILPKK